MKTDRLEFYKGEDNDWRWRYVRKNGRILADSAEGYSRRAAAVKAASLVTGRTVVFVLKGLVPNHDPKKDLLAVIVDD